MPRSNHLLRAADSEPRRVADLVNVSSVAGRVARAGSGAYNATKHAVGAFSEALRQEVTARHVRVGLVEPGAVDTELPGHNRPEILEQISARFGGVERLAGGRHRRRDRLHGHATPPRGDQRAARPADRAAGVARVRRRAGGAALAGSTTEPAGSGARTPSPMQSARQRTYRGRRPSSSGTVWKRIRGPATPR